MIHITKGQLKKSEGEANFFDFFLFFLFFLFPMWPKDNSNIIKDYLFQTKRKNLFRAEKFQADQFTFWLIQNFLNLKRFFRKFFFTKKLLRLVLDILILFSEFSAKQGGGSIKLKSNEPKMSVSPSEKNYKIIVVAYQ